MEEKKNQQNSKMAESTNLKKRTDPASPQVVQVDRGQSLEASRPRAGPQQSSLRDPARSSGAGSTASAARSDERNQIKEH